MSVTLASGHLKVLQENFTLPSKTSDIINNGIKVTFEGRNAVTIFNVETVAEVDYVRSGTDRFGTLFELGNGTQTLTLSQDKGATWSIDTGNYEDTLLTQDASASMDRQMREVAVPNTDIYRLAIMQAYAVANGQSATAALTTSNAFQKFLDHTAALTDAKVPEEGRVCYMTEATYNLLRLDQTFTKACNDAYADLKTGARTMVNGVLIKVVPTSYLVLNTGYLFTHKETMISPVKLETARVLTEQRGIDGAVCEYRRYYDAFIPTKRGASIRAHMTA